MDDDIKAKNVSQVIHLEEIAKPAIEHIDFKLDQSDLLIVSGRVGSGKTTLLYSIMDETEHKNGDMKVRGKIAYVE